MKEGLPGCPPSISSPGNIVHPSVINSDAAFSRKPSLTMPTAINLNEGPHLSFHGAPSLSTSCFNCVCVCLPC